MEEPVIEKRVFEAASLDPVDRFKLMTGLIVPRPIGWIGSRSPDGLDNLAPFSFFNMVAGTPPTLLFTTGMTRRVKDTLANVRATGVFTVNVVTDEVAEAMNATSGDYASEVNEFELAGVTKVEAGAVAAPMVAEAKANFECEVSHIHEVGDGPSASVVFGEIQRIHVSEHLLDGTRIDLVGLKAVGRLAGPWYSRTADQFAMERPEA
ncbi:MAG: flavin reductase family protein [Acidimicrobiia bacterium]